jgi:hypothetical protein
MENNPYGRFQEYIQQEKSKIDEAIELLMAKNISDITTLNTELQFLFKKIGVARRWCEIKEIEIDEPTYFD